MTDERRIELAESGFCTPREAADHLGLCLTMLYRLMGDGSIKFVKIGKARRVSRRSLMEYAAGLLAEQETRAVKAS